MIVDFDVTDDRVRRARPRWFLAALAGVAIGALVASLLPEPAPPLKADALVRQSVANLSQARSYHKRGVATYPDVQGMARFYEISVDIDGPYNNRVVWNSADPANAVESLSVDGHRYEHRPEGWSESSFPAAISTHPHEPLGDRWTFVDGPTLHEVDQAVIDGRLTRHLAYSANVGDIAYSVFEAIGIPPRGVGTIVTSPATIELWIGAVDAQITRVRYTLALGSRVYYFEETYSHLGEAPVPAIVAPTAVQVDAGAGAPLGPLDAYLSGTAAGDRARALRAWTVLSGMPRSTRNAASRSLSGWPRNAWACRTRSQRPATTDRGGSP